ncbi:MAG: DUF72 domain-containing protein [Treponema sp.]|nr:DUF72 domain-containing protein [Treponema sp.]
MKLLSDKKIVWGTSGYDYPEWRGVFYPEKLKRSDFLAYYAMHFTALEVNFTFYRMPVEEQLRSMMNRSGRKILFAVKAPRSLTHNAGPGWDIDAASFRAALLPLVNGGILSAVLFQFPQSFHYEVNNRIYLNNLLSVFTDYPSVVEFRHSSWFTERVYKGLDKRGAGIVLCDMPHISALPPLVPVVTGKRAYIRFHGRNADNWYVQTADNSAGTEGANGSSRYRYTYTPKELAASVPFVKKLAEKAEITHVFFNNHPDGAAAVNAEQMKELTIES